LGSGGQCNQPDGLKIILHASTVLGTGLGGGGKPGMRVVGGGRFGLHLSLKQGSSRANIVDEEELLL